MVFEFAVRSTRPNWIALCYNHRGLLSRSGTSTRANKSDLRGIAISVPRVCRQIYSETATLLYSENCFAFQSKFAMKKWLSKRLRAQREAICYMMLQAWMDIIEEEGWPRR